MIVVYNSMQFGFVVGMCCVLMLFGEYVMFEIVDMGVGMMVDVFECVFEFFFMIKLDGEGIGFGFSMVFGFVKESGGYVLIDSMFGQGIIVCFMFLCCYEVVDEFVCMLQYDVMCGCEMIFVVEDDVDVWLMVVDMFVQFGYKVIMVFDGEVVLCVFDSEMLIDLLFIDVIMLGCVKGGEFGCCVVLCKLLLLVLFILGYICDEIFYVGWFDFGVMLFGKFYWCDEFVVWICSVFDVQVDVV